MNARSICLALALPLAMAACQGDLYPVAPEVPNRVAVGSPDPGSSTTPAQTGPYNGQLVSSGAHYLELVGYTPAKGTYTLYVFPWTAAMNAIPFVSGTQAKLSLSNGQTLTLSAATNPDDGSLFFYAFPGAEFKSLDVTLQAEVKLSGAVLSGRFDHPER